MFQAAASAGAALLLTVAPIFTHEVRATEVLSVASDYEQITRRADVPPSKQCMDAFLLDRQSTAPEAFELAASSAIIERSNQRIGGAGSTTTACNAGGYAGIYPCKNVDLESHIPLAGLQPASPNLEEGSDGWGWRDPSTQHEYALVSLEGRTTFVNVTDRNDPVVVGWLPSHNGANSFWNDVKTFGSYAYMVSEASGHGVQVFDMAQLRDVSRSDMPVTFAETGHYPDVKKAHNLFINEDSGFAYVVGANGGGTTCAGGLHMLDLRSDPGNPQFAGCYSSDGYTHDVHCVIYDGPDAPHRGREVCFACNEDTVTIADVTVKSEPELLSKARYDDHYTHQGWLTEDHRFFVFGDEMDERSEGFKTTTYVLDVSNLREPTTRRIYTSTAVNAIDHNQYIVGHHTYQANYRAGLRVLDLSGLDVGGGGSLHGSSNEVGYFDIYPASDSSSFNGAWSVYPFFRNTVLIFGIEQGLFVVSPDCSIYGDGSCRSDSPAPQPTGTNAPVAPVAQPTPMPTSSPTGCQGSTFTCTIITDEYPSETSWTLKSGPSLVASGGGYEEEGLEYTDSRCLREGFYTFNIEDSFGDGLCCGYGMGSYAIAVNGTMVGGGGSFGATESTQFRVMPPAASASPTPTVTPTAAQTTIGTPTSSPSTSNPAAGGSCSSGQMEVFVRLQIDMYGDQTSWKVQDGTFATVLSGSSYSSNSLHESPPSCLNKSECYSFTIDDIGGDGLCCSWGNGFYEVVVDGEADISGGQFYASETRFFGLCLESSSASPSTRPSSHPPPSEKELATIFDANNGQAGNMFDVVAINDISVVAFDINTREDGAVEAEVFTKTGTWKGHEDDANEWTLVMNSTSVLGQGTDNRTPLGYLDFPVFVPEGATQAFYVTLTGNNIRYTNGHSVGSTYVENSDLIIKEGCGKRYLFGRTYEPRVWNGVLRYSVSSGGRSQSASLQYLGEDGVERASGMQELRGRRRHHRAIDRNS